MPLTGVSDGWSASQGPKVPLEAIFPSGLGLTSCAIEMHRVVGPTPVSVKAVYVEL